MKRFVQFLLISSSCLITFFSFSQNANDYLFSSTIGSYTEISGGTVLGSSTSDDHVFNNNTTGQTAPITNTGFPIGFNFVYRGATYDKFAVNNNGWILLGTGSFTIGSAISNAISTTGPVGYVNVIAALGRDLQGQTGSELSFLTTGSAPNRCLVVQWKNYRRYSGTGESYNFQIRLYETTNKIEFVYGAFTVNYTSTTHPQVGIRGATNTDYHNRATASNWSSTTKGTINSATCTFTTTIKPASGLKFTFYVLQPGSLNGHVYDYNSAPLAGATVGIQGGASTTTDASGYYSFSTVNPNNYNVSCSKSGYNTVTAAVAIAEASTTVQDFVLTNPEMAIDPGAVSEILLPTETGTRNVTVKNDGNGNLQWFAGSCEYTIKLYDTYGDGWNNCKLDVKVNGNIVLDDITLATGSGPATFTFNVVGGANITTSFTSGSYPTEPYYYIYNCSSNQVWYSAPGNSSGPVNILPGQLVADALPQWIVLNPVTGTTAPFGGATDVEILLDATKAESGSNGIPGQTYYYNLIFSSSPDVGTISVPISLTIADPNLAGPVNFHMDAINTAEGKIRLAWEYWADAVVDHFVIIRNGVEIGQTKKTSYIDTVEPGYYCYVIYAVYDNGFYSPASNEICTNFPLDPRVPVSNWALILGVVLIVGWTIIWMRKRS